jgi:hypothetical protein
MPAVVSSPRLWSGFRRVCAWCCCDLGVLPHPSQHNSYGICASCTQDYFADLYEADEAGAIEGLQERACGAEQIGSWASRNVGARNRPRRATDRNGRVGQAGGWGTRYHIAPSPCLRRTQMRRSPR